MTTRNRIGRWVAFAAAVCVATAGGAAGGGTASRPLLGANYLHYEVAPPSCGGVGVVNGYDRPHVRQRVRAQLAAMRAAGMRALRLVLYHSSEGEAWNVMRSAGGRLAEPHRTNLAHYLADVRAAGFASLTVAFNPWDSNDPIGYTSTPYDESKLDENWQLIRDVRPLVKQFGPQTTRLDLINEGAPHWWQPRLRAYVVELWTRYVEAYGADDATVSVIANEGAFPRLPNLIDALRAAGQPLPTWFDVHPSWSGPEALADIRRVDGYLADQRLTQPLVIAEEAYDNADVAKGIATFIRTSSRPVLEVMEWPLSHAGTTFTTCPNPPYRIAAFARALTDIQPYTLDAEISRAGSRLVSAGARVSALAAGSYMVVVHDRSAQHGFRLVGPRSTRRTTASFRGTVRWRVRLQPYDSFRYGGLRGALEPVTVLGGGGA